MPIHDWSSVDAGLFHDFHQSWIVALRNALNSGGLPPDYFALAEQSIRDPIPDVLTLHLAADEEEPAGAASPGIAVAAVSPRAQLVRRIEQQVYARKADRVTVRHRLGAVVAVLEIVSPDNKASKHALRDFVEKSAALIDQGVHLLVIDLFPPSRRDPQGIHKAIWDELADEEDSSPTGKPLTLAAYDAGPPVVAYVQPVAAGDTLPDMPLFLKPDFYVPTPLESTYEASWIVVPTPVKRLLVPHG
jgi:hypothetical protein